MEYYRISDTKYAETGLPIKNIGKIGSRTFFSIKKKVINSINPKNINKPTSNHFSCTIKVKPKSRDATPNSNTNVPQKSKIKIVLLPMEKLYGINVKQTIKDSIALTK